jgi:formate hydrogenlyase subunit 3/multisubunit Na+/H+ antiporter MnhD subunit
MVERRAATGELALLGGMARGRPVLATVLMTVGVIALAVPLSTAFAGEFLILAGVFAQSWVWAAIGAGAIVLAAMYVLRLVSAILHEKVGAAVSEAALDLRPGELAVVVPLVAILLALSAWPNAITHRAFGADLKHPTLESALVEQPGGANELLLASPIKWYIGQPAACHAAAYNYELLHGLRRTGTIILPCLQGERLRLQYHPNKAGGTSITYSWSKA